MRTPSPVFTTGIALLAILFGIVAVFIGRKLTASGPGVGARLQLQENALKTDMLLLVTANVALTVMMVAYGLGGYWQHEPMLDTVEISMLFGVIPVLAVFTHIWRRI
ncbi:MAG: hypothetical protein MUP66_02840 [Candidatus Nanohaloarchaeota archaeon QJJ-5]|nr:hypothetical protein [Candidatus Nanohaloarchaeota archaeon QJJ-5]